MATKLFTWNAIDVNSDSFAVAPENTDIRVSNSADGTGDASTVTVGDQVWLQFQFPDGDFFPYEYLGEYGYAGPEAPPPPVNGSAFKQLFAQPDGSFPNWILSNEEIPNFRDEINYWPDSESVLQVCFAAGTLITTPDGESAVETLTIGDMITTADGKTVPVKWLGRQTIHKQFTLAERFVPVRVKAGALSNGVPHSDLVLTSNHALILDGLAINAGALVNGTSISLDPVDSLPERVTYYHIETEAHDVILANGAAAETFVDYVTRSRFDNFSEYEALYGSEAPIPEMDIPRISAARLVPDSLWDRLAPKQAIRA